MPTYVLSDLHLDEAAPGRLFEDERQGKALAALCARIAEEANAELVLLGDTLDLTSMLPPRHGLPAFAKRVGVPLDAPSPRTAAELCSAAARANPIATEALAKLAERAPVFIVPGNHDRHLAEPGGAQALAAAGLGKLRLEPYLVRELAGRTVVLQHGHHFDAGNRHPGGTGEAMTACLHHAVLPYLQAHGARTHIKMDLDRLVALRPEEAVISLLQRWLGDRDFERFFHAFLDLLAENGYLPHALAFLARFVPVDQVRAQVRKADRLWEDACGSARACLRGDKPLPLGAPRPDLLILGHTHMLDWVLEGADRLYVNLGTWTERAYDATGPLDTTLPLLELRLADGVPRAVLRDLTHPDLELQRYQPETRLAGGR